MAETPFPEASMELTTLRVVSDPARSQDWYVDVLGAELIRSYGSSVVLKFLGHWLLLVEGGGPTRDKPTVSFAAPSDPDQMSTQLTLRVPDCQGAYATLVARGAEFLAPPVRWDHGEIRAFFRDPDGHLFEISEARVLMGGRSSSRGRLVSTIVRERPPSAGGIPGFRIRTLPCGLRSRISFKRGL